MTDLLPADERHVREQDDFIIAVQTGMPEAHAAVAVGWSRVMLKRFMRDPDFRDRYEVAIQIRDGAVEEVVYKQALAGKESAWKFWLTNRQSDRWAERRTLDVKGEVKVPVSVTIGVREGLKELLRAQPDSVRALQPGGILDVSSTDITDADS